MAKEQIAERIQTLKKRLQSKEHELMAEEDFHNNNYTLDSISNLANELENVEAFLSLSSNDPTLQPEIYRQFDSSLSWIDRHISHLKVIRP